MYLLYTEKYLMYYYQINCLNSRIFYIAMKEVEILIQRERFFPPICLNKSDETKSMTESPIVQTDLIEGILTMFTGPINSYLERYIGLGVGFMGQRG